MSNIQASCRVVVDVDKINRLLSQLNDKEAKKAVKSALRKSALIIRKQAQQNLVASFPVTKSPITKKGVAYKPLKNEINIAVYRNASGARIDLLDRRKPGSRAFVLKFIELGTTERATNKGANRGNMKASYFFKGAVNAKMAEAENSLEQNIIDAINKVVDKNK